MPVVRLSRRELLSSALAAGGAVLAGGFPGRARGALPLLYRPFQVDLPIPPVLAPVAPFETSQVVRSEWQRRPTKYYVVRERRSVAQIVPGIETPVWGYEGLFPGPTVRARIGEPVIIRFVNELGTETVVHQHGGHTPPDSDGSPEDFIPVYGFRDYLYPQIAPEDDPSEVPSTMWYHDHTLDLTGPQLYQGLAGFFLVTDDVEDELVASRRLPGGEQDIPFVIQDRALNGDGTLHYDTFAFNGFLGDLLLVNGKVQPRLRVERRKYRFRILNGANARFFELRLSHGRFLQVGADSWLLPRAVERDLVLLSGAERADVVVDFRNAPDRVYLENVLVQDSGRGPRGNLLEPERKIPGAPILEFQVSGAPVPNDATVTIGDVLRPHVPIRPDEIVATRTFRFERKNGLWAINGQFYDSDRLDARPRLGTAERWILENGGGGWWHPIHIHLEAHQVQRISGRRPPAWQAAKKDTTLLGPNDVAEVFMKFRTFTGPYVFHCHNAEHEDHRMMGRFGVVP